MGEVSGTNRENYRGLASQTEADVPDDAYILPDRRIGALEAAERAQAWLDQHPEGDFDNLPPGDIEDPPKAPSDDEDIDALILEAQALAKSSREMVNTA